LHVSIDKVIATVQTDDRRAECKAGCAFCCSAKVEVSDMEALVIARAIHKLPAARQEEILEALRCQSELRSKDNDSERIPCALLENGLCSIYSERPATCRKAHSLSAKACADQAPLIPQNLAVALNCEVLIAGTNEGFRSRNLPASANELSAAVLAALTVDSAAEHWYQGQPLLQTSSAYPGNSPGDVA
jgi:Fe-S-cluster containining protein